MSFLPARFFAMASALLVLTSCGSGYKRDDPFYDRDTGKLAGTILEVGNQHTFPNGLTTEAIRYRRAADGAEMWSSRDAFELSYEVRKK